MVVVEEEDIDRVDWDRDDLVEGHAGPDDWCRSRGDWRTFVFVESGNGKGRKGKRGDEMSQGQGCCDVEV